ncbi:MAG: ABC transporter permease, partial [Oscillospiraceae bacterium]|nr:ABC transporter permease [Oscillospiraceae bacterium]
GVAGQYTFGAFGALVFAIVFQMPWWACLIAAAVFGAIWGAVPGIFKALLNINEVITSIMFNWIALFAVNTIMYGGGRSVMYDANKTKTWSLRTVFPDAVIPDLGIGSFFGNRSTTIAVFFAAIVAVAMYIVLDKTTFGYELKACGLNKNAAKYAGINDKKSIIMSMIIAGGLAGFGAGLYYLSGIGEWSPMDSTALPSIGFSGISVALLALSNPIGIIFSALFISHITTGGGFMNANLYPPEIANVISGIIIYLSAFSLLFKLLIKDKMPGLFRGKKPERKKDAGSGKDDSAGGGEGVDA